jgi:hypothetical protein
MIAEAVATKFCSRCENTYPATLEHFHRNITNPDGLGIYCRDCQRQISGRSYRLRMERLRASPSEYRKYRDSVNRRERKYREENRDQYLARKRRSEVNRIIRKLKLK